MYTSQDIERCFNAATRQYLENKNRGGSSGQKGTRYEDYFAVYKIAQLAPQILETGLVVYFTGQILAFVDDLIIDIPSQPLQHYQLKNSKTVSWSTGPHPIQDDFANQHHLNQAVCTRASQLFLLVADATLAATLDATIPSMVRAFSQVLFFPHSPDILTVVEQVPDFRAALVYLSAFEAPEPDKIDFVAKALIGAWITSSAFSPLGHDLLTQAQSQSPQYIRSFQPDLDLDPKVKEILQNIEDFEYNLAKGFLHWDYANGLQSGTPPYSIETDTFRRLQERIKDRRPTTFEELENLL